MGRKKTLLEGTTEQQLAQVDNILTKLIRRSKGHRAVTYIPPVPVMSSYFDKNTGDLVSAVIPSKGVITSIALYVKLRDGVNSTDFEASLKGPKVANSHVFSIKHILTMDNLNIPVEPGNVFSIRALSPENIEEASASALYHLSVDKATVIREAMDEIEGPIDERI